MNIATGDKEIEHIISNKCPGCLAIDGGRVKMSIATGDKEIEHIISSYCLTSVLRGDPNMWL